MCLKYFCIFYFSWIKMNNFKNWMLFFIIFLYNKENPVNMFPGDTCLSGLKVLKPKYFLSKDMISFVFLRLFAVVNFWSQNFPESISDKMFPVYNLRLHPLQNYLFPLMRNWWFFLNWKKNVSFLRCLNYCVLVKSKFQNLWRQHRHCYIIEVRVISISFES